MFALAGAVRMPGAALAGHEVDRRETTPAVFAGVLRLFAAFVKFVPPLPRTVRMPWTHLPGEEVHTREPLSAVFAIKVRHFPFPFLLFMIVADSPLERRVAQY